MDIVGIIVIVIFFTGWYVADLFVGDTSCEPIIPSHKEREDA